MATRFFVDDTTNVLLSVTESDGLNPPDGATAVAASVIEAAYSGIVFLGGTWDGTTYTPPDGIVADTTDEQLRLLNIHSAYVDYHARVRKGGWVNLSNGSGDALRATDRWIYYQAALADRIARGEWSAIDTDARRDAALSHLVAWMRTGGYTWYSVVKDETHERTLWYGGDTAGGQVVYTDLLVATGANAGDPRTPDVAFNAVPLTIHANFDPELPSLRNA